MEENHLENVRFMSNFSYGNKWNCIISEISLRMNYNVLVIEFPSRGLKSSKQRECYDLLKINSLKAQLFNQLV